MAESRAPFKPRETKDLVRYANTKRTAYAVGGEQSVAA
jgi:hypothetical protein